MSARTRLWRVHSSAFRSFGSHPRAPGRHNGRHNSSSYLQIVFRAEHVRVSDADASERHRDKHRSLRLLPAVITNLQRHPGRCCTRGRCWLVLAPVRLLWKPGLPRTSPSGSGRAAAPRVPSVPRARFCDRLTNSPCDCLGLLARARDHFSGYYPFPGA